MVHLICFIQLWEIERTNANNNSRAKIYAWTMNCVVSSWPFKNPLTIAQGTMQDIKTHTRIVIRTSKCTAKIPGFVILNSIILVCLDRRHHKLISSFLCNSTIMWHQKAETLLLGTADWRIMDLQCSKLTFSKSHLLATFYCKTVGIKKFGCQIKT